MKLTLWHLISGLVIVLGAVAVFACAPAPAPKPLPPTFSSLG